MTPTEIISDIRSQFPHIANKVVLSPEDVAPIVGIPVNVQNKLRHQGRLHIPCLPREKGGKVLISIYDLAGYLSNPDGYTKSNPLPIEDSQPKRPGRPRGTTKSQMAMRNSFWETVDMIVVANEERDILMADLVDIKPSKKIRDL